MKKRGSRGGGVAVKRQWYTGIVHHHIQLHSGTNGGREEASEGGRRRLGRRRVSGGNGRQTTMN